MTNDQQPAVDIPIEKAEDHQLARLCCECVEGWTFNPRHPNDCWSGEGYPLTPWSDLNDAVTMTEAVGCRWGKTNLAVYAVEESVLHWTMAWNTSAPATARALLLSILKAKGYEKAEGASE